MDITLWGKTLYLVKTVVGKFKVPFMIGDNENKLQKCH